MENQISNNQVSLKVIPLPVKVLAIWNYIIAVGTWISGILMIVQGSAVSWILGLVVDSVVSTDLSGSIIGTLGSFVFNIVGFIVIVIGFISFFVGRGLWRARNWARILTIIVSIFGVLSSLGSVINGNNYKLISLIIYLAIGVYLIFDNSVKESFKRS